MTRWLVLAAVGCTKSAAPPASEGPADGAVTFAFLPDAGPVQRRKVVRSVLLPAGGPPQGTEVTWTEQITAAEAGDRWQLRIQRDDPVVVHIGVPTADQANAARIQNRLMPRDLWLDLGRDGAFLGVDLERTPGALDGVRADIAAVALAGGESEPIVHHFQSMVSAEQVRSLAGNAWALGSGFYGGSPTLTPGKAYEINSAEPVPMLGPSPVDSTTLLEVLGRVPCHAAADDLGCLEVMTFTEIDPEAMAARLHAYLQQVAAHTGTAAAPIRRVESVERAQTIIDPSSLAIWRLVRERRVQVTVGGDVQRREITSTEVRLHHGEPAHHPATSLPEARAALTSTPRPSTPSRAAPSPAAPFALVSYASPVGALSAYVTKDPGDDTRHPAIVWLGGGDTQSIGDVWSDQPMENDQSAAAYRTHGLVMMFPALRGGNDHPGPREGFLGEVDDVLAAADHLASLPYVDPDRVYLGGHSTGATLALLVAASSDRFRGVFAFGPVSTPIRYGGSYVYADLSDARELRARSPRWWVRDISTPTWVIEGSSGNAEELWLLRAWSGDAPIRFVEVAERGHFDVLGPANDTIARAIAASPDGNLALGAADLQ